jgi:hypothetical protein
LFLRKFILPVPDLAAEYVLLMPGETLVIEASGPPLETVAVSAIVVMVA